jgi:hypothetical protein
VLGHFLALTVSFNNLFSRHRWFLVPNCLYFINEDLGELLQNGNKQADYTKAGNFLPTERLSAFQKGLFHRFFFI